MKESEEMKVKMSVRLVFPLFYYLSSLHLFLVT